MASVWDPATQEEHGGQTWRQCGRFVCDFSVTTNGLGPPAAAVAAATAALREVEHYPPADAGDATRALADRLDLAPNTLLLGNGASELIDLVMRAAPPGPIRTGPFLAAYREYERAARTAARGVRAWADGPAGVAITVLIRPNSPTGDWMPLEALERVLEETRGLVLVDESFVVFYGKGWRQHSALALLTKFPRRLLVVMSWTKIWACPGLRLGSVACSAAWHTALKRLQTPWSCNSLAQRFCVAACADQPYLERTWQTLPRWRRRTEDRAAALGWKLNAASPPWVPWVFCDTGSPQAAARATAAAQRAGCPLRPCDSFGIPQYVRLGIRAPEHQDVLFAALEAAFAKK